MITCGHSKVKAEDERWRVHIDNKVAYALRLFSGQTLFGAGEKGSERLFLSTLRLNPHVSYFRIFLEDIRGSLATVTKLFADRNINILSGGAFGFGNLWVSEFLADFKDIETAPEAIIGEIEGLGGFAISREITELFPRSFDLQSTYEVMGDHNKEMYLVLPGSPQKKAESTNMYAVLKAWPRIQALIIDFFTPQNKLLKISVKIQDIPGSLYKLAGLLGTQINLHAIDEQHHDEASGEWTIYGLLVIGGLDELKERAGNMPNILRFDIETLGWQG